MITPEDMTDALATKSKLDCIVEDLYEDLTARFRTNELSYVFAALLGRVHADCKTEGQRVMFIRLASIIHDNALSQRLKGLVR